MRLQLSLTRLFRRTWIILFAQYLGQRLKFMVAWLTLDMIWECWFSFQASKKGRCGVLTTTWWYRVTVRPLDLGMMFYIILILNFKWINLIYRIFLLGHRMLICCTYRDVYQSTSVWSTGDRKQVLLLVIWNFDLPVILLTTLKCLIQFFFTYLNSRQKHVFSSTCTESPESNKI